MDPEKVKKMTGLIIYWVKTQITVCLELIDPNNHVVMEQIFDRRALQWTPQKRDNIYTHKFAE